MVGFFKRLRKNLFHGSFWLLVMCWQSLVFLGLFVCFQISPFYKDQLQQKEAHSTSIWPQLNQLHLWWSYFQIRSLSEILGLRTSTYWVWAEQNSMAFHRSFEQWTPGPPRSWEALESLFLILPQGQCTDWYTEGKANLAMITFSVNGLNLYINKWIPSNGLKKKTLRDRFYARVYHCEIWKLLYIYTHMKNFFKI